MPSTVWACRQCEANFLCKRCKNDHQCHAQVSAAQPAEVTIAPLCGHCGERHEGFCRHARENIGIQCRPANAPPAKVPPCAPSPASPGSSVSTLPSAVSASWQKVSTSSTQAASSTAHSMPGYQEGKPCPKCKSMTMPTSEAEVHVTCISCGNHWCWPWGSGVFTRGAMHEHVQRVHGGVGFKEEDRPAGSMRSRSEPRASSSSSHGTTYLRTSCTGSWSHYSVSQHYLTWTKRHQCCTL